MKGEKERVRKKRRTRVEMQKVYRDSRNKLVVGFIGVCILKFVVSSFNPIVHLHDLMAPA